MDCDLAFALKPNPLSGTPPLIPALFLPIRTNLLLSPRLILHHSILLLSLPSPIFPQPPGQRKENGMHNIRAKKPTNSRVHTILTIFRRMPSPPIIINAAPEQTFYLQSWLISSSFGIHHGN